MLSELRYALRRIRQAPGFAFLALVSLALGIGANATMFSLLNTVALRTLGVPEPQRLAGLATIGADGQRAGLSYTQFEEIRARQQAFRSMFAWDEGALLTFEVGGSLFPGTALLASDGFAETTRLQAAIGRVPADGETSAALLSYRCWRTRFQGSAAALGPTIRIQGKPFVVAGVAPPDFTGMEGEGSIEAVVPLAALSSLERLRANRSPALEVACRLKPAIGIPAAESQMASLWEQVRGASRSRIQVESAARGTGFNFARVRFAYPLKVLVAITGLLLLLASVNLATLLLARSEIRRREVSIRLALGAGRVRIVRQHLVESLLLALGGTVGGLVCARWAASFLSQFIWTGNITVPHQIALDGNVAVFTLAAGTASGLLFGLMAAWHGLRGVSFQSRGVGRTGRTLLVVQIALSLVLVTAGTAFSGSLRRLQSLPLGFEARDVIGLQLMNRPGGYAGMDPQAYYGELYSRLAALAGVRSVSAANLPPVMPVLYADRAVTGGGMTAGAQIFYVAAGFFRTMEIPMAAGREFSAADQTGAPRAAVLSESLAKKLFGGSDAVGREVVLRGNPATVIGVARDSYIGTLQKHNRLEVFLSMIQEKAAQQPYVVLRTSAGAGLAIAPNLRRTVAALGREYPLRIETMDTAIARALVQERMMASLAGGFAILALLLGAIGVYGLMAFSVSARTREIGVRMALGAERRGIVWMVLRETLLLAACGLAVGAPGVWAGSRLASGLVFGAGGLDPASLGEAAVILVAGAMAAALAPARRAAGMDPASALKYE
jgi:putative ABC transport system permease protein